eukprot:4775530-Amphidinium_carterae.1
MFANRGSLHTIYVQKNSTGCNQPLDLAYFRAFRSSIRRGIAEAWAQDILAATSPGLVAKAMHELEHEGISIGKKVGNIFSLTSSVGKRLWCQHMSYRLMFGDEHFVELDPAVPVEDEAVCQRPTEHANVPRKGFRKKVM